MNMEQVIKNYYVNEAKKLCKLSDKVLVKLKFYNVDNEHFYSLADEVFVKALKSYDKEKDFDGFLYSCLEKKFKSEMTKLNREKRKADKLSISIDEKVGNDEDGLTIGDIIADPNTIESEIFHEECEWSKEVKEYLEKLSPLQRQIAFLLSDNNTPDEICEELHITMKHFENSLKRILADEKIRPLRPLVERM